jgi:hypothetical protein
MDAALEQTAAQDLDAWSVDHLEDGLTTLAGQIAAATCRFLEMLAEYDRRRGWTRWDCVSAVQWLSWRCQIDPRTAREHLRVAHRLAELPLVTEQFRLGRLSYSKVRALTRVATHDNESDLLALARQGTAAQLERAIAAYRRVGRVDDAVIAEEQLRSRRLDWRYEDDGSMVIRVRLPADRGELALAALRAVLDHATSEADAESGGDSGEGSAARDPEIRSVESGGHTDEGKTEATLDHRSSAGSAEPLEPQLSAVRAEPAHEVRHADPRQDGSSAPAGEVADDPRAAAYADAFVAMAEHVLPCEEDRAPRGDRHQVVVYIDAETLTDPTAPGESSLQNGRPLPPSTVRRMTCDAAIVPVLTDQLGEPLDVGRKSRTVPSGMRRAVIARDRSCRHPSCDRRIEEIHHVDHWIDGGETGVGNLIGLCWFHHARHHQGAYDIRLDASGQVVLEGTHGDRLSDWTPPGGSLHELLADLAQRGIEVDPGTSVPDWYGDPLDVHLSTWILTGRGPAHPDGYAEGHDPREGWRGATCEDPVLSPA